MSQTLHQSYVQLVFVLGLKGTWLSFFSLPAADSHLPENLPQKVDGPSNAEGDMR